MDCTWLASNARIDHWKNHRTMDFQNNGKPGIRSNDGWLTVDVYDDLNLTLIAESGQTFRMKWISGDLGYLVQTGDHAALVRQVLYDPDVTPDVVEIPGNHKDTWHGTVDEDSWQDVPVKGVDHVYRTSDGNPNRIQISCSEGEWESVWREWFDMDRSYNELRKRVCELEDDVDKDVSLGINTIMTHGEGIRILRQDPWETLCTFIISQRRSIPSIKTSVRRMSERWGGEINAPAIKRLMKNVKGTPVDSVPALISFPTANSLSQVEPEVLNEVAGLGYRDKYVHDAAVKVAAGELDLGKLNALNDEDLLKRLESLRGVGVKIASCTALFAYGRLDVAPVDVWIQRVIKEDFDGEDVLNHQYKEISGLVQQWMYYWALRNGSGNLDSMINEARRVDAN